MPQYILSLSYGKDSLACLGAIKHLGWPLDRIMTADVWATDEIPAEYPPVVAFKAYVDKYIEENFGIIVEHYCATRVDGVTREKVTYEDGFYHTMQSGKHTGGIKGFPMQQGSWCQKLKLDAVKQAEKMTYEKLFYSVRESGYRQGQIVGFPFIGHPECQKRLKIRALEKLTRELQKSDQIIQYLGIAADESDRIASYIDRDDVLLPLVELGWEEDLCGLWCKYSGLLSPTYDSAERDGCWFCHNQGVNQLRHLRRTYPELWALLLSWDADSPTTFKPGRSVHDFDKRFRLEDEGKVPVNNTFRWNMINKEDTNMINYTDLAGRTCPRIKAERERLGVEKKELAATLGYGLGNYSAYENKTLPSLERLVEMADHFGCSVDYLLGRCNTREVQR